MSKSIRLYWWSEVLIQKKDYENYGDLLGKYLVEKISHKKVIWQRAHKFYLQNFWKPLYVTIGSILEHIGTHCTVWGSGIISRDAQVAGATFLAVRGPLSRKRIQELGYDCPAVYGDPALLLPLHYNPIVEKEYQLGIVPHINDYELVQEWFKDNDVVKIINFKTNDVEQTTSEIISCERILSSSLHGIIVAHAYQIPAVQVQFSDRIYGDGVKYHDYLMSVDLEPYDPEFISKFHSIEMGIEKVKQHEQRLPQAEMIQEIQNNLMKVCPFKPTEL
ncbi:polysaccharide pyruvyl transferase family protein [Nonlabens mediterrranea]|uniref:Polysaccharide pyruvyl transferase family protein n=1 Tax=Nonlabens mediterrranea TaxID=1419947 RepID=A0ABS0A4W4_9FLAO|nr:polysaccharide pyruvyl transferase family protein [Nonlabens mediterrranea]